MKTSIYSGINNFLINVCPLKVYKIWISSINQQALSPRPLCTHTLCSKPSWSSCLDPSSTEDGILCSSEPVKQGQIHAHAVTCCSARPLGRTQIYLNSICTRICIQFVCWDHLWVLRPLTQLLSASIAPLSGRMWLSSHQTWKFSGRSSLELENTRQFVDLRTITWEGFALRFQKWKKHFDLWSKVTITQRKKYRLEKYSLKSYVIVYYVVESLLLLMH